LEEVDAGRSIQRPYYGTVMRTNVLIALPLMALVASCNAHPVEPFSENLLAEAIDVEVSAGANKVDILFIVDDSGSMCEEQASLRSNIAVFIDQIVDVGADFHLAVITTDMTDPEESGRFQNIPDNEPGSQCTAEVDISQCATPDNGEEYPPLILRASDPRYLNDDGSINRPKLQRDFGCSATVGIKGDGFEMGLEAAKTAMDLNLRESYNAGFLRDDAFLGIIFISDENDCSDRGAIDKVNGNACEWNSGLLVSTQEYIDFFANLKGGDKSRVILGGIIAPDIGARYSSPEPVQPSCVSEFGEGYAGYRYKAVIDGFENSTANICDADFSPALDALGVLFRAALENKCLNSPPDTCVTSDDCSGVSRCETTPRGSGTNCTDDGRCFCEHFTVQVEVIRPSSDGPLDGRDCSEIFGTDDLRCILLEGQDQDYYLDYNATGCSASSMAIEFRAFQPGLNDQVQVRYPRSITFRPGGE
jgi:hypothetical protein